MIHIHIRMIIEKGIHIQSAQHPQKIADVCKYQSTDWYPRASGANRVQWSLYLLPRPWAET